MWVPSSGPRRVSVGVPEAHSRRLVTFLVLEETPDTRKDQSITVPVPLFSLRDKEWLQDEPLSRTFVKTNGRDLLHATGPSLSCLGEVRTRGRHRSGLGCLCV